LNRDHVETAAPRVALACAAVVMVCTTLGVLVLLPASIERHAMVATPVQRTPPATAQARARAVDAPRSITTIPSMEKRS
jgi:hypothetical protein